MTTETLSDTNYLLEQLRLKNCAAFSELYDKYAPALLGIIHKIVKNNGIEEELLQDVFVKVWKNIERYDATKGTLFTWMLNIARNTCIDYLQKIINENVDLRYDLQCSARLMHLLAHYEMGNNDIIEHLIKSVYRFMSKMENLTVVEEEMFRFLRRSFHLSPRKIKPEFEVFLQKIKHYEKSRFETRAFAYLDIISWVESKVYNKPMGEIIYNKYKESKRKSLK